MSNSIKIKPDKLGNEIENILKQYSDDVVAVLPKAAEKAAKACVKELKANAPKKSGAYAKSFTSKKTKDTSSETEYTVYSNKPGLAHLLEYGHKLSNQYGVYGHSPAHPHWAGAEEKANEVFEEEIEKAVEKVK